MNRRTAHFDMTMRTECLCVRATRAHVLILSCIDVLCYRSLVYPASAVATEYPEGMKNESGNMMMPGVNQMNYNPPTKHWLVDRKKTMSDKLSNLADPTTLKEKLEWKK